MPKTSSELLAEAKVAYKVVDTTLGTHIPRYVDVGSLGPIKEETRSLLNNMLRAGGDFPIRYKPRFKSHVTKKHIETLYKKKKWLESGLSFTYDEKEEEYTLDVIDQNGIIPRLLAEQKVKIELQEVFKGQVKQKQQELFAKVSKFYESIVVEAGEAHIRSFDFAKFHEGGRGPWEGPPTIPGPSDWNSDYNIYLN